MQANSWKGSQYSMSAISRSTNTPSASVSSSFATGTSNSTFPPPIASVQSPSPSTSATFTSATWSTSSSTAGKLNFAYLETSSEFDISTVFVDTSIAANLSSSWTTTSFGSLLSFPSTYALTILATETVTQAVPDPATANTGYGLPLFQYYHSADYTRWSR